MASQILQPCAVFGIRNQFFALSIGGIATRKQGGQHTLPTCQVRLLWAMLTSPIVALMGEEKATNMQIDTPSCTHFSISLFASCSPSASPCVDDELKMATVQSADWSFRVTRIRTIPMVDGRVGKVPGRSIPIDPPKDVRHISALPYSSEMRKHGTWHGMHVSHKHKH